MIAIIDYGLGNSVSVRNMIKKVGGKSVITKDEEEIRHADKLILPGVGHFMKGMENLKRDNLDIIIKEECASGKPLLGICLGMQLLTDHSDEGDCDGLGLIPLKTRRFDLDNDLYKVPNMGWQEIDVVKSHPYLDGFATEPRFYFVHSYYVESNNTEFVIAESTYSHKFASIIGNNNVVGMQFHPEKSHKFGMQVFRNFLKD